MCDNLLGGADSITELKNAQDKVIALLNEADFEIHQWAANCPDTLPGQPDDYH